MNNVKNVKELCEAGFSVEKIARVVYGDAHPFCVELVEMDLFESIYREDRGAIALFLDDVERHQTNMERSAWVSNHVLPLVTDIGEDELLEVCGDSEKLCDNCRKCIKD